MNHFEHFFVHDTNAMNLFGVVVKELVEFGGGGEGFDLAFVGLLTELAPERIQHHFGQGA